jgi:nitrite reductase/ring-hydroxylating ferredoxin subunit
MGYGLAPSTNDPSLFSHTVVVVVWITIRAHNRIGVISERPSQTAILKARIAVGRRDCQTASRIPASVIATCVRIGDDGPGDLRRAARHGGAPLRHWPAAHPRGAGWTMSDLTEARASTKPVVAPSPESLRSDQSDDEQPTVGNFAKIEGLAPGWWPVALSTDLGDKPIAVRLSDVNLALYRDDSGTARSVLDRCPHRRMPLSLGRITDDGLIQCGYHGWSFNGAGTCERIPNFRPGERPSGRITVDAFANAEQGGMILIHSGGDSAADLPNALGNRSGVAVSGAVEVRAPHTSVVAALAFNPGAALGMGLLFGSGDEVVGPDVDDEPQRIVVVRDRLTVNAPRLNTFDAPVKRSTRVRIETLRETGLTSVTADIPGGATAHAVVGVTPVGSYRTVARWQLHVTGRAAPAIAAATAAAWAVRRRTGRAASTFASVADNADTTYDPVLQTLKGTL